MNSNQNLDVQTVERFVQVECEEVYFAPLPSNLVGLTVAQSARVASRLNHERAKEAGARNWATFASIHNDVDLVSKQREAIARDEMLSCGREPFKRAALA